MKNALWLTVASLLLFACQKRAALKINCSANLQTDAKNCGECGLVCSDGSSCVAGLCSCANAALTACSLGCTDVKSDAMNCGRCGNACVSGGTCVAGSCVAPLMCAAGETVCGGACSNTASDKANCGGCGVACPAAQVCNASDCGCPASAPGKCGSSCYAFASDPDKCSNATALATACAASACAQSQMCTNGACAALPLPQVRPVAANEPLAATALHFAYFSPVGWTEPDGKAGLIAELTAAPSGAIYECSQKHFADLASGEFLPCDGASGNTQLVRLQTPATGQKDGTYQMAVRTVQIGSGTKHNSATLTFEFYVHTTLNGVGRCTGSLLTDDDVLTAINGPKGVSGGSGTSGIVTVDLSKKFNGLTSPAFDVGKSVGVYETPRFSLLQTPHTSVAFVGVHESYSMARSLRWPKKGTYARNPSFQNLPTAFDITLDSDYTADRGATPAGTNNAFLTLRHRLTHVSRDSSHAYQYLFVRRDRPSSHHAGLCSNNFEFGNSWVTGPNSYLTGAPRYERDTVSFDCEVLALNAVGEAICVTATSAHVARISAVTHFGWAKLLQHRFSPKCTTPGCADTRTYKTFLAP